MSGGTLIPLEYYSKEVWSGTKVSLARLKTFCCADYVQNEKNDKLDPKANNASSLIMKVRNIVVGVKES